MRPEKQNLKDIFNVKGKVVIITGGAGALGMQYAEALGKAGARVILWDSKEEGLLQKNKKLLSKAGVSAEMMKVDITDEKMVQQTMRKLISKYKHVDSLINNAAMNPKVEDSSATFVPYEDYSIELWERELKVNLTGMMICTKAVAPFMMKQKSGSIINIASEVSNIAHDHRVYDTPNKFKSIAYTTSKTAVLGFTRQWAARLGGHNVRVNAMSPGGVKGPGVPENFANRFGSMNMLGRMARPGEYNGIILFLVSEASSFLTGTNITADGGKSAW